MMTESDQRAALDRFDATGEARDLLKKLLGKNPEFCQPAIEAALRRAFWLGQTSSPTKMPMEEASILLDLESEIVRLEEIAETYLRLEGLWPEKKIFAAALAASYQQTAERLRLTSSPTKQQDEK